MGQQIEQLARFAAETTWEQIPDAVRQHAKLVLLDMLGVILAGAEQPEVRELRAVMRPTAGAGATVLARGWPSADPRTAALLNGIAGRSIELCEGHRYVTCQGVAQVLPGAMAVAEWAQRSGSELLAALIVGYDVAIRLGSGLTVRPLAHQNGQTALIGASAAGARLRGLNTEQVSRAMRIAATLLLTPSYTNAVAGATALNVAGGMSGFAAGLVPDLALAGFAAQDDGIEEALGHLVGDGFKADGIADELGTRWEITRNYFRLRACCSPTYPALDALEEGLAVLRPKPEDVDRIDVVTFRFASAMRRSDPPNHFAARYSMPHAAAAIIVRGNAGYGSFTEPAFSDPVIVALRQRVHISDDPSYTAAFPRQKMARVTITLKDGRRTTHTCESPRGDFNRPYEEWEVRGKFRELAGLVLTPKGVEEVENAVDHSDEWRDLGVLTALLRRHSQE